ncbi:hypothetical protein IMZ48_10525 [Candidatus Bathyarchaeota archaeon]|nr:hypothetical protein [Candidatus Bathyarchaeota archaeon]
MGDALDGGTFGFFVWGVLGSVCTVKAVVDRVRSRRLGSKVYSGAPLIDVGHEATA